MDYGYLVGFAEIDTPDLRGMFWATQLGQVQLGLATFVMWETSYLIGILREQLAVVVGLAWPWPHSTTFLLATCGARCPYAKR